MSQLRNVAVLVGSLRKDSFNRKAALALAALAPASLKLEIVEIGGLPHYNQDLDSEPPAPWVEFRGRVNAAAGVLFVTPEYGPCPAFSRTPSTWGRGLTAAASGAASPAR